MTRRATIAIDFDVTHVGHAAEIAADMQMTLTAMGFPNVEVTVLDDGAPTLPAATATGPATSPRRSPSHDQ